MCFIRHCKKYIILLVQAAILYNLKARNAQGVPYTRTGDIVIAVNPYEWITDLYTEEKQSLYAEKLVFSSGSASIDPKSEVDPHVYETSALAYRGLAVDSQNQSILVSGESGAGKTETVKILMSHLASIQSSGSDMHSTSKIVQRVLDSNPLLEAFGNAKTVRNDNSSRFGKFIQLQFDTEDPTHAAFAGKAVPSAVLAGSKCETYLLEKSRVVSHSEEERTYHIFYQLLASEDDVKGKFWDGLVGKTQESFSFVGYSDTNIIEGKSDQQRFQMTLDALYLIGVQEDKLVDLMRALCIVLQLGNLTFSKDPSNEENAIVTSVDELEKLSELMGVDKKIVEKSLLERTVSARNEVFKVPLNLEKAQDSCHALAKEIYSISFDWLVNTINHATCAEENYVENPSTDFRLIGLLDIFGFESFTINRFEQLCINYANEKLQQKFTLDIFRSVQQEYEFEGIELGEITYIDNSDVLNLIEGRMGLISVLNEECVRPKGNDTAFVNKIYAMNKDITCLYKDRLFRDYQFGIKHYAGKVEYDASGFVTKNMDNLPVDLLECRKMSTNSIVSCDEDWSSDQLRSPIKPNSRVLMKKQSSIASDTVWAKFRSQLNVLMANIGETRTRYIRCIKPNSMKKPRIMQHLSSIEQLRCAGVVAAVTISRSAFPNRLLHEQVFDRFMCLDTGFHRKSTPCSDPTEIMEDLQELLGRLLSCLDTVSSDDKVVRGFVCGKTRAYFRAGSLEHLENRRLSAFGSLSTDIQRIVRGYLVRSGYRRLRNTAIKMQAYARRKSARRSYLNLIEACLIIQCWSRQTYSRRLLITLKRNDSATKIQSQWRMVVTRQIFTTERFAAVKIQACIRGAIQRPLYQKALAEAIEEAKLENQLKTLQRKLEEAEQKRIEAEQRAAEGGGSKTIVVYKDGSEEHGSSPPSKSPELTVAQQTLMDESSKMLEYLRKEVFKLRSQNSQLRTDFELLKENNQRLMDANASAGASFASLNQHAKTLSKANAKLKSDVTKYKDLSHQLQMSQVELKEELKMKQGTYIAEVHSRLQYQKTMMKIVDMIQERCKDHRLVEDILHMSDDCESDYMTGPTGVDLTPVKRAQARTGQESLTGKLKSFLFS
jgi:myosin-5